MLPELPKVKWVSAAHGGYEATLSSLRLSAWQDGGERWHYGVSEGETILVHYQSSPTAEEAGLACEMWARGYLAGRGEGYMASVQPPDHLALMKDLETTFDPMVALSIARELIDKQQDLISTLIREKPPTPQGA